MRLSRLKKHAPALCFAVLFVLLLALNIWKLPYGWSYTGDESFYLAVPHRLLAGDAPVTQEWNLSQTSGYLLIPLVWLFEAVTGGTEGIILFSRSAYLFFHSCVTLFLFLRLRKRNSWGAAIAALLHFSFVPYHTMALSYNTIPLEAIAVAGLLLAQPGRFRKTETVFAGALYAVSVLASPFLLLLYPVYALAVLLFRKRKVTAPLLRPAVFGWFTLPCVILAGIVVAWVVAKSGIAAMIKDLPWLTYEPNHSFDSSMLTKAAGYLRALLTGFSNLTPSDPVLTGCWIAEALLIAVVLIDRGHGKRRGVYLSAALLITALALFDLRRDLSVQYHLVMLPLIFAGLPAFLLSERKDIGLMCGWFIPGIVFSVAMYLSSNNESYVISMALSLSNLASAVFITQLLGEMKTEGTIPKAAVLLPRLLLCACMALLLFSRIQIIRNLTYWDEGTYNIHHVLTEGPARGVKTSDVKNELYGDIMADVGLLRQLPEANTLFIDPLSYPYLALNYPVGSFSPWVESMHLEKLEAYYQLHPEKIPDYICIPVNETLDQYSIMSSAEAYGYRAVKGRYYIIMIAGKTADAYPGLLQ